MQGIIAIKNKADPRNRYRDNEKITQQTRAIPDTIHHQPSIGAGGLTGS
jgi:hypothetical protein